MTKLEEKLINLKFEVRIKNNEIFYIKDMVIIKLNYNNTEINRIETFKTIYLNTESAIEHLEENIKIIEELRLIEREIRLEEISNDMYEECN